MEFVPILVLGVLVTKLTDLLTAALAKVNVEVSGQAKLVVAWVAAVVALLVFGASRWAGDIKVGPDKLSVLSVPDIALAAFAIAAVGAIAHDTVKAVKARR